MCTLWQAGIAVAPKPQAHLYNAWFQEIYMNDLNVNADGYTLHSISLCFFATRISQTEIHQAQRRHIDPHPTPGDPLSVCLSASFSVSLSAPVAWAASASVEMMVRLCFSLSLSLCHLGRWTGAHHSSLCVSLRLCLYLCLLV